MGLFTRDKLWLSADRASYIQRDDGAGTVTLVVDGVAVLVANSSQVQFLSETMAGETITGALTANALFVGTTALLAGATTQSGIFNAMTTARLLGNSQIGASTASLLGIYGNAPIQQPTATAQGQLSTGAASGALMVTATAIATTGVVAGFQNVGQVTALLTNFNNLVSQVDQTGNLANAIRTALVGLGWIKGSN